MYSGPLKAGPPGCGMLPDIRGIAEEVLELDSAYSSIWTSSTTTITAAPLTLVSGRVGPAAARIVAIGGLGIVGCPELWQVQCCICKLDSATGLAIGLFSFRSAFLL